VSHTLEEGPAGGEPVFPKDGAVERRMSRSRRRMVWAAVLVVVLAGGAFIAASVGGQGGSSGSSRAAPMFRFPRLDAPDREVSLSDYRGRPVVVNFWASWCVPCQKEMPAFQAAAADLEGRVAFLGVNEQDIRAGALALQAKTGVRYTSAFDPEGKMMSAYLLRGLPATAFVSARGDLVELHTGQINGLDLRATIDRLFKPGR
jgi:cytochrome c biogenesis protein CcmG/thiol:disulfide interchange protein DsbE